MKKNLRLQHPREEKREGVKNSAQALTLKEEVSTKKMGERRKMIHWKKYCRENFGFGGEGIQTLPKEMCCSFFSPLFFADLNHPKCNGMGGGGRLDIWLRT